MIEKCCAFTGHRPRKFPWGYNKADTKCVALKQALTREIVKLVEAGYTDFFSGMAEGTDTWASLAVLALKKGNPALKLHCVLPCEGQADGWSALAQELYSSILEQADEVVYVSRKYSEGCMLKRNRFGRTHHLSAGYLQRRVAGRNSDDGEVCQEVGAENRYNSPVQR